MKVSVIRDRMTGELLGSGFWTNQPHRARLFSRPSSATNAMNYRVKKLRVKRDPEVITVDITEVLRQALEKTNFPIGTRFIGEDKDSVFEIVGLGREGEYFVEDPLGGIHRTVLTSTHVTNKVITLL